MASKKSGGHFAHTLIEGPDGTRYRPGDTVPDELVDDGLIEGGAVSADEYVEPEKQPAAELISSDGHRYVLSDDTATSGEGKA